MSQKGKQDSAAKPAVASTIAPTKPSRSSSLLSLTILVAFFASCVGTLNFYITNEYGGSYTDAFNHIKSLTLGRKDPIAIPSMPRSQHPQDALPSTPFTFTVHFNGDGLSIGLSYNTSELTQGLDEVIVKSCLNFIETDEETGKLVSASQCDPSEGAKLYSHDGVRMMSLLDIQPGSRTYVVPQGLLFVYPLGAVGQVIYPRNVVSPIEGKPIKLKQLTMSPRVFSIENFVTPEELQKIIEHNADLVKPSEVGFSGWRDKTRTSSTAWDFHSWAAKRIQKRSFEITGYEAVDHSMADALQVLRYDHTEWYKPHCDWFDSKGYDNHDPTINNGTNRFATVFVYLSDVEEGGHTVFPLSTTHEGYNGEQLVHKGTEKTAGYIADKDAAWVCNTSSTALRSAPKAGSAVLFYSQGPRGELDKWSLHGGCPVISGIKWAANVWLWNRPKPSKSNAKDKHLADKEKKGGNGEIYIRFENTFGESIDVSWDDGSEDGVFQVSLDAEEQSPMTTYESHRFIAKSKATKKRVGVYRVSKKDDGNVVEWEKY